MVDRSSKWVPGQSSVGPFLIPPIKTSTIDSWIWATTSLTQTLDPWGIISNSEPVLNSRGNIREDCYLPHDIHPSKFGAQVVGSTINRLLKQIVRSTQYKSQFRFLKLPFPLLKRKNIQLGQGVLDSTSSSPSTSPNGS